MTREEIIEKLEELIEDRESFIDDNPACDIFREDAQALREAVKLLSDTPDSVVHGRWILDSFDQYANHYHCDKCGKEIDLCNEIYTKPMPNYCPNCGAKMN